MVSLYILISPYLMCLLSLIVTLPHHALSLPPSESRFLVDSVIRCLENADIPKEDAQSLQRVFPEPPWFDPSSLTTKFCPNVIEFFLTKLRVILAHRNNDAFLDDRDDSSVLRENKQGRLVLKRSLGRSLDQNEIIKLWSFINDLLRNWRRQHSREVYGKFRPGVGVEWETGKSESQNLNLRIRPTREMPEPSTGNQDQQQEMASPIKAFDPITSSDGQRQGERIPEQKRGYGSWYDVMRIAVSKRRTHVLSINNAMVALSDLMMEQQRNRVLKNRERMRYHMLLQG